MCERREKERARLCLSLCVCALLKKIEFSAGVENAGKLEALNIKHIVCVNEQVFFFPPRMIV